MKAKTIKAVLRKKFDDFVESIQDENTKSLVKKNTIITGGCIASMLLKEKVNDFDLYFTNRETVKAVADYYVEQFKTNPPPKFQNGQEIPIYVHEENDRIEIRVKSAGIAGEEESTSYRYFEGDVDPDALAASEYVSEVMDAIKTPDEQSESFLHAIDATSKPRYRPVFLSSNAITLSDDVQLILRFYGDAKTIHENYDFVHCTSYWESKSGELTLRPEALECLLARELRYIGSKYPIASMIRTRKFIKRDFSINAGMMLKMAMQISHLDLENVDVLREQLVGVDTAFFSEMLSKLKEKKEDRKVESSYLMEIIDRLF